MAFTGMAHAVTPSTTDDRLHPRVATTGPLTPPLPTITLAHGDDKVNITGAGVSAKFKIGDHEFTVTPSKEGGTFELTSPTSPDLKDFKVTLKPDGSFASITMADGMPVPEARKADAAKAQEFVASEKVKPELAKNVGVVAALSVVAPEVMKIMAGQIKPDEIGGIVTKFVAALKPYTDGQVTIAFPGYKADDKNVKAFMDELTKLDSGLAGRTHFADAGPATASPLLATRARAEVTPEPPAVVETDTARAAFRGPTPPAQRIPVGLTSS